MTFAQPRRAVLLQLRQPGRHRARSTSGRTGDAAAHPDTWADTNPVGTGPFTVEPVRAEQHPVHREPDTTGRPGKPYIQKIEYPAYLDNGPANLDLASGKAQWGSQFIPNIKKFYLSKSAGQPHLVAAGDQRRDRSRTSTRRTRRPASSPSGRRSRRRSTARRSPRSARAASSRPPTRPASSCRRSRSTSTRPRWPRPATTSRTPPRPSSCWRAPATRRRTR